MIGCMINIQIGVALEIPCRESAAIEVYTKKSMPHSCIHEHPLSLTYKAINSSRRVNICSRQNHLKMAASDEHIPHELILDIISRLLAKSLGRFRCVNKLWCNSIVDSDFIQMHLGRAIQQDHTDLFLVTVRGSRHNVAGTHTLVGDSFDECVQIENPLERGPGFGFLSEFKVLGSCNGLICSSRNNTVCLLNPCTREYKMMQFQSKFTSMFFTGLGYDSVKQEYILVELAQHYINNVHVPRCNVYSMNDASLLNSTPFPYCVSGEAMGIYLNGFLHWVARTKDTPVVISFDNREKNFRELLIPPINMCQKNPRTTPMHISLGVLQGQLCIFGPVLNGNIELWVMQKYGVSDSLMKVLSLDIKYFGHFPSRVLCFSETGKLVIKHGYHLQLCDPKEFNTRTFRYRGVSQSSIRNWIPHVASLVQLNSGTYLDTIAGAEPSKKKKRKFYR